VQGESQHTVSTQFPDVHWMSPVQLPPFDSVGTHTLLALQ
jgi:hypothetical protein